MSYLEDRLQEIADAIKEMTNDDGMIPALEFADRIREIQTGYNTSDATATAEDIKDRKIAYIATGRVRGAMPEVTVPVPIIDVDTGTGLITATCRQEKEGYVYAGEKESNAQLTTQISATITPTTERKVAVPIGRYTTGTVYVAGDPNLTPENIKRGVTIFGVLGQA